MTNLESTCATVWEKIILGTGRCVTGKARRLAWLERRAGRPVVVDEVREEAGPRL